MNINDYVEKLDNMIEIVAPYGYIIKDNINNVYCFRAYCPLTTDLSKYELVVDNAVNERFRKYLNVIHQKEDSLNKIGRLVASQVTDDLVALEISEFYDDWAIGVDYVVGQYVNYQDILYKVLTNHTSQESWSPSDAPSLFSKVLTDPTGETILEWKQPDSTNPYMTGDKVIFEGATYESLIDNNIWSPSEYPAGWQLI